MEQTLPSIQQSSNRITTDLTEVKSSMTTVNNRLFNLDSDLERGLSILQQDMERLPGVLENKILTTLGAYFDRQTKSTSSDFPTANTVV